jgi:hypothetical protein
MSQTKAQLIEGSAASELTAAKTLLGAGSASAPSLTVTGDTNTGIYFPAADTIGFVEGGVEAARIDSSSNFQFNSGYGSVATAYGCRAWVNFNGTGTVAIRASGNVSSITDNGTGDYTVNFTTAMPDNDYSTQVTATPRASSSFFNWVCGLYSTSSGVATGVLTSSVRVATGKRPDTSGYNDEDTVNVSIFR